MLNWLNSPPQTRIYALFIDVLAVLSALETTLDGACPELL